MGCQASSSIASIAARTVLIIRTPIEYCQPACSRRSKTLVFQNPESARMQLDAGRAGAVDARDQLLAKRSIPFWVFADPLRRRMCNVSRVSALVARIGW